MHYRAAIHSMQKGEALMKEISEAEHYNGDDLLNVGSEVRAELIKKLLSTVSK